MPDYVDTANHNRTRHQAMAHARAAKVKTKAKSRRKTDLSKSQQASMAAKARWAKTQRKKKTLMSRAEQAKNAARARWARAPPRVVRSRMTPHEQRRLALKKRWDLYYRRKQLSKAMTFTHSDGLLGKHSIVRMGNKIKRRLRIRCP